MRRVVSTCNTKLSAYKPHPPYSNQPASFKIKRLLIIKAVTLNWIQGPCHPFEIARAVMQVESGSSLER